MRRTGEAGAVTRDKLALPTSLRASEWMVAYPNVIHMDETPCGTVVGGEWEPLFQPRVPPWAPSVLPVAV